jgi:hypothetical protein
VKISLILKQTSRLTFYDLRVEPETGASLMADRL